MTHIDDWVIWGLWIGWLIYWSVAGRRAKSTMRRETLRSQVSHLLPQAIGIWLLASPRVGGALLQSRFLPASEAGVWCGIVLLLNGLAIAVAARVWLGGNWSGIVTVKQNHELIRSGPYRWVRHPIYTGLLLGLSGTAIAVGRWRALLGVAIVAVAFLRKISIEERFMQEQFGEAYQTYRKEVPSLLPFRFRPTRPAPGDTPPFNPTSRR